MVLLIPANANPTVADIDTYLLRIGRTPESLCDIKSTVREIECKSGAGALLHPAESYFLEQSAAARSL
jgi:hypothetical protein